MNGESEAVSPRRHNGHNGHNGVDHHTSPDEIERDLARTRADLNATIHAIEHRLSPGELVDQALDYLRGGPRDFAVHLGEQARDNPMPVALSAIGIGWLMFSTTRDQNGVEYTSEGIAETKSEIGARGREMYGSTRESMQGMGENVKEKSSEMGARVSEGVGEARESVSRAAGNLRQRARSMASGMREGRAGTASAVRHSGERARDSFSYLLREQPLVLGMVGLAIGAALGAGLPTTQRERETLGPARDAAVNRL